MEALAIIVGFAGVVVGAVLSYFFTRSHYERKRRDDLADREFTRRASIYDMRIGEARNYVDKIEAYSKVYKNFAVGVFSYLVHLNNQEENINAAKEIFRKSSEASPLVYGKLAGISNIKVLEDEKLDDLNKQLEQALIFNNGQVFAIQRKLKIDGEKDGSLYKDLDVLNKGATNLDEIIVGMKKRLDQLASELK